MGHKTTHIVTCDICETEIISEYNLLMFDTNPRCKLTKPWAQQNGEATIRRWYLCHACAADINKIIMKSKEKHNAFLKRIKATSKNCKHHKHLFKTVLRPCTKYNSKHT